MALDVFFRDEADAQLNNIYDYIASEGRPDTAIAYVRRIRDACMALAHFPERGNKRDDILPGLRTVGFERRSTIIFRVLEGHVEIVSIAYGGRDFESRMKGL